LLEFGLDRVKGDMDCTRCQDTYADARRNLIKMLLSWRMNCWNYFTWTASNI